MTAEPPKESKVTVRHRLLYMRVNAQHPRYFIEYEIKGDTKGLNWKEPYRHVLVMTNGQTTTTAPAIEEKREETPLSTLLQVATDTRSFMPYEIAWPWREIEEDCTKFIAALNRFDADPMARMKLSLTGQLPTTFYDELAGLIRGKCIAAAKKDHDTALRYACCIAKLLPSEDNWFAVAVFLSRGGKCAEAPRSVAHALQQVVDTKEKYGMMRLRTVEHVSEVTGNLTFKFLAKMHEKRPCDDKSKVYEYAQRLIVERELYAAARESLTGDAVATAEATAITSVK